MANFKFLSILVFLLVLVASSLVAANEFEEVEADASFPDDSSLLSSLKDAVHSETADSDLKREKRSRSDFIADTSYCNDYHCNSRCRYHGCWNFYCTRPKGRSSNCVCRGHSCY